MIGKNIPGIEGVAGLMKRAACEPKNAERVDGQEKEKKVED